VTVLLKGRPHTHRHPGDAADRHRRARWMAYLGCAGALGYGGMKVIWALGGTLGMSNPARFHTVGNGLTRMHLTRMQQLFDNWGTQTLALIGILILLGLVYPWGQKAILRPLLRTLGWAGSLVGIVGVAGFIMTLLGTTPAQLPSGGNDWGSLDTGVYLFTYVCFTAIGVGFAGTAWLTRRSQLGRS
jgi:hypothetical protein